MCDCYNHPCCIAGCGDGVPFHIADFAYRRSEFMVWCEAHVDFAPADAVRFEWEYTEDDWGDPYKSVWRKAAILGPEVNEHTNSPNAMCRVVEVFCEEA